MEDANKHSLSRKTVSSQSNLSSQVRNQHGGARRSRNKHLKCNICGYEAQQNRHLVDHMRSHTGERPFKCTVTDCGMAFKLEKTLENHIRSKHSEVRPYKCKFPACLYKAKTASDLINHMKVHSVDRPCACPHSRCDFRAKTKYGIVLHTAHVHSLDKAFACSKCDYKTAGNSNLKKHMLRHSERGDFKCKHPQCEEYFKSSSAADLHFSNRHGERKAQCNHPGCGRNFASTNALNKHKSSVHSKKIHACPKRDCSYRTNRASILKSHILVHGWRKKKIPCSIKGCEYKGPHGKALKEHMRRHETLLSCPVSGCGGCAPTEQALKEHVKLHNPSGRPFQCPLCFKHFKKLQNLKKHCAAHTNEKPLRCGHCEFAAARQDTVKTHISWVHGSIAYPFIVHPMDKRECLRCKVTLSFVEFVVHSMSHAVPVVMVERLEISCS